MFWWIKEYRAAQSQLIWDLKLEVDCSTPLVDILMVHGPHASLWEVGPWRIVGRVTFAQIGVKKAHMFLAVQNSSIGDLVTDSLTHSLTHSVTDFYFCHTTSIPWDLLPLRHLIRVMRRSDLTKILDDNLWWQFLMTIFDDNFRWQFLMTIFDDNLWW